MCLLRTSSFLHNNKSASQLVRTFADRLDHSYEHISIAGVTVCCWITRPCLPAINVACQAYNSGSLKQQPAGKGKLPGMTGNYAKIVHLDFAEHAPKVHMLGCYYHQHTHNIWVWQGAGKASAQQLHVTGRQGCCTTVACHVHLNTCT